MNKHFIKEIEIKNYKCFQNFNAKSFSRINLISGKNNVGKTAFMEAFFIGINAEDIKGFTNALIAPKIMRESLNIFSSLINDKLNDKLAIEFLEELASTEITVNNKKVSFDIEDTNNGLKKYLFSIDKENISLNAKEFVFSYKEEQNKRFIDNFGLSNGDIISDFSSIQKRDEEDFLNQTINDFDSTITTFKIIDEKPQCKMGNVYYELNEFGDGLRHLISIIIELFKCENGYLFIDEVDNGIHYTKLDDLWIIILKISAQLNIQIFATTHSKECIESYARVAKELKKEEDIAFIELGRDKESQLKAIVMKSERFYRELYDGNGVRGW